MLSRERERGEDARGRLGQLIEAASAATADVQREQAALDLAQRELAAAEVEAVLDPQAIESGDVESFARAFHDAHLKLYSHADVQARVQMVNLRLVAVGHNPKPAFTREPESERDARHERMIPVYANGNLREVPLYLRDRLFPGDRVRGPAVVAQEDATVCIVAGFDGRVDGYGNLLLHREGA